MQTGGFLLFYTFAVGDINTSFYLNFGAKMLPFFQGFAITSPNPIQKLGVYYHQIPKTTSLFLDHLLPGAKDVAVFWQADQKFSSATKI